MNAHIRQPLPNRRFRRLLPAALATAALATAGLAGPAKADTTDRPPRAKPAVSATVPATTTTRAPRMQPRAKS